MDTGIRRFILRLAVGLLAFLLGVAAAWAITGLNPFQGSSGTPSYKKRCGSHRSWSPPRSEGYYRALDSETVYEGRSCKTKRAFGAVPPPPPPPAAPAPPGGD